MAIRLNFLWDFTAEAGRRVGSLRGGGGVHRSRYILRSFYNRDIMTLVAKVTLSIVLKWIRCEVPFFWWVGSSLILECRGHGIMYLYKKVKYRILIKQTILNKNRN